MNNNVTEASRTQLVALHNQICESIRSLKHDIAKLQDMLDVERRRLDQVTSKLVRIEADESGLPAIEGKISTADLQAHIEWALTKNNRYMSVQDICKYLSGKDPVFETRSMVSTMMRVLQEHVVSRSKKRRFSRGRKGKQSYVFGLRAWEGGLSDREGIVIDNGGGDK